RRHLLRRHQRRPSSARSPRRLLPAPVRVVVPWCAVSWAPPRVRRCRGSIPAGAAERTDPLRSRRGFVHARRLSVIAVPPATRSVPRTAYDCRVVKAMTLRTQLAALQAIIVLAVVVAAGAVSLAGQTAQIRAASRARMT